MSNQSPLCIIDDIFQEVLKGSHDSCLTLVDNFVKDVSEHFRKNIPKTQFHDYLTMGPLLEEGNQLVHFRCMVQDSFDDEYVCAMFSQNGTVGIKKNIFTGLYRDELDRLDVNPIEESIVQRSLFHCVPIPGETSWVRKKFQEQVQYSSSSLSAVTPVCYENEEDSMILDKDVANAEAIHPVQDNESSLLFSSFTENVKNGRKRHHLVSSHQEQNGDRSQNERAFVTTAVEDKANANNIIADNNKRKNKKMKIFESSCLVKIIDDRDHPIKICDILDVYGILGSRRQKFTNINSLLEDEEILKKTPSYYRSVDILDVSLETSAVSLDVEGEDESIPVVHVIYYDHGYLIPFSGFTNLQQQKQQDYTESIRQCVIQYLASFLQGDTVVAEYLLLHLLSRTYSHEYLHIFGKFSLNIRQLPDCKQLEYILENLCSRFVKFSLTVDELMQSNLVPRKNYDTNRLDRGFLQLSNGTQLLVDETCLKEGQLKDKGVYNLQVLKRFIATQKVSYDFTYDSIDFTHDVPVVSVSKGISLFSDIIDVSIPCIPNHNVNNVSNARSEFCPSVIDFEAMRRYLSIIIVQGNHNGNSRCFQHQQSLMTTVDDDVATGENNPAEKESYYMISEEMQKIIQDDFVQERKEHSQTVDQNSLHIWLTMARLVTLSRGLHNLTEDTWRYVKTLERERLKRLSHLNNLAKSNKSQSSPSD